METFPVAIPTPPLTSLTTGDRHSCGIAPSGAAICWGTNTLGELGDGTVRNTRVLVETDTAFLFDPQTTTVDTDIPFRLIAAGSRHTCALDTGGRAHCWGNNRDGELGTGPANECFWSDLQGPYDCRTRPAPVLGGLVFESLSAGAGFTCGVSPQGAAYCWGRNSGGQLGNGSRAAAPAPAPVAGGLRFTQISAGTDHACGLTDAGLLYCWGRGVEGQLGTGQTADALAPVPVAMQADAAAIALGPRRF
jgi:alpha-tubulin suppressor-like RCC1 family protein